MKPTRAFRLCAISLLIVLAIALVPALAAVRKAPSNKYTVFIAYFTATPKPLRPGQVRGDIKSAFPKDGMNFTLDISTPMRFKRQIESTDRNYEYSLELVGTEICENGVQLPFSILPDKKDPNRTQMTGVVTAAYSTPNVANLTLASVSVYVSKPGVPKPVAIFKLEDQRPAVLGRTYIAGSAPSAKGKNVPIYMLAVSVIAGG